MRAMFKQNFGENNIKFASRFCILITSEFALFSLLCISTLGVDSIKTANALVSLILFTQPLRSGRIWHKVKF